MKQDEKAFYLELEAEPLEDKTELKPSFFLVHGFIPAKDQSRYDTGYLMRLCKRGFVRIFCGQNSGKLPWVAIRGKN